MEKYKSASSLKLTVDEKLDLLIHIQDSTSKQWTKSLKEKIISQNNGDKDFIKSIKKGWTTQQEEEMKEDPLEEKMLDRNGVCIANRNWKCNAKNCRYQPNRGNCQQLAIKVAEEEKPKLSGDQKYACLQHYRINFEKNDHCYKFFKLNHKLPAGATLNFKAFKPSPILSQPSTTYTIQAEPQAGSSSKNVESIPSPSESQDDTECESVSAPLKTRRHPNQHWSDSSDEESDTERASVISTTLAVQNLLVKKSGTKSKYYTILIFIGLILFT